MYTRSSLNDGSDIFFIGNFPVTMQKALYLTWMKKGNPSNDDLSLLALMANDNVSLEMFNNWHENCCLHPNETSEIFLMNLKQFGVTDNKTLSATCNWKKFNNLMTQTGDKLTQQEFLTIASNFVQNDTINLCQLFD